ncbi:hypothetical protein [Trichocoleus sp. DQ-U1]|uniref:hypothetical protein n=1 Tax=Trichocoleus sp. DQ-U1 TaxID=2933926 RepID=UPI00329994A8
MKSEREAESHSLASLGDLTKGPQEMNLGLKGYLQYQNYDSDILRSGGRDGSQKHPFFQSELVLG